MDSNALGQENLLNGFEFDIFEASLDQGQTRSDEPDADAQCSVITDRGRHSKYKVQALLKTCIHGVLDATSKTPASLIIVDYFLSNLEEQGRYSSVTTTFDFEPHVQDELGLGDGHGNALDTPNIAAYAPFEAVRWGQTTAQESSKHNLDASIEPEVEGAKAGKIGYAYESTTSHEQRYFTQGLAGRHYVPKGPARGVADQVWWNMQHNFSQHSGVPPHFRTAILLTRRAEAAEKKFIARFKIAVRGGFWMNMSALVDVFLRRSVQDRPVVFDPSIRFMGDRLDGIEPNADGVYELGRLAVGRELVKLTDIWGLSPLPKA
ncbi:hypothetical protein MANI_011228 [Metarhizium anisopliae]